MSNWATIFDGGWGSKTEPGEKESGILGVVPQQREILKQTTRD